MEPKKLTPDTPDATPDTTQDEGPPAEPLDQLFAEYLTLWRHHGGGRQAPPKVKVRMARLEKVVVLPMWERMLRTVKARYPYLEMPEEAVNSAWKRLLREEFAPQGVPALWSFVNRMLRWEASSAWRSQRGEFQVDEVEEKDAQGKRTTRPVFAQHLSIHASPGADGDNGSLSDGGLLEANVEVSETYLESRFSRTMDPQESQRYAEWFLSNVLVEPIRSMDRLCEQTSHAHRLAAATLGILTEEELATVMGLSVSRTRVLRGQTNAILANHIRAELQDPEHADWFEERFGAGQVTWFRSVFGGPTEGGPGSETSPGPGGVREGKPPGA